MIKYYKADGTILEVVPVGKERFTLKELQSLVGGMIEVVPFPDGTIAIANENGIAEGCAPNKNATDIWNSHFNTEAYGYATSVMVGDILVGNNDIIE